jgi:hypothetical protein
VLSRIKIDDKATDNIDINRDMGKTLLSKNEAKAWRFFYILIERR